MGIARFCSHRRSPNFRPPPWASSDFLANSYCANFSVPSTLILEPKGGFVITASKLPNWMDCLVSACQVEGGASASSQKTPPRPSPTMAMYAFVTLVRKASLSIPRKQRLATSLRRRSKIFSD